MNKINNKYIGLFVLAFAFLFLFFSISDSKNINAAYVCVKGDTTQAMPEYQQSDCEALEGYNWVYDNSTNVTIKCFTLINVYTPTSGNPVNYYQYVNCEETYQYRKTLTTLIAVNPGTADYNNYCKSSDLCYKHTTSTNSASVRTLIRIDDTLDNTSSCYDINGVLKSCANDNISTNNTSTTARFCYDIDENTIYCDIYQDTATYFLTAEDIPSSYTHIDTIGIDTYQIDGSDVNLVAFSNNFQMFRTVEKIQSIIATVLLPIIWASLGALVTIKGTITGLQIMKSADDPQTRQEKIKSLSYLVIGIAIAYGISFAANPLLDFFQKTLIN